MTNKQEIKLNQSALRKLNFIFKGNERKKIFDEASFYSSIYSGLESEVILEAVINKNLKTKIHKVIFNDNKEEIKNYNESLKLYMELEKFI